MSSSQRPEPQDDTDHRHLIGWLLVGLQFLLLVGFVVLPWRRSLGGLWPPDIVAVLGGAIFVAGVVVGVLGMVSLGSALTPTPVPLGDAALRTSGVYGYVRHPVYSGILLGSLGFVIMVGSIYQAVLWLVLLVFFALKASWEDRMLADRHGVRWFEYADHVGGLVPRFWRRR